MLFRPSVTWRREDGGPLPTGGILHEGSVLEIPRAERGHRGGYVCSAENGVGRETTRKVVLKVRLGVFSFTPVAAVLLLFLFFLPCCC